MALQALKNSAKIFSDIKTVLDLKFFSQIAGPELIINDLAGKHSGVTVFSLNRPKQKNAFGALLVNEVHRAVDALRFDGTARVLVVASLVPGVFSAGADLKERAKMSSQEVHQFVNRTRSMLNKIYELPIPVIAAIDGVALGGGMELSLACDIRVASTNSKMGLVETKLAIIPGAGGTQRLSRLINPSIAKELIYTARIIDGQTAKSLGIVNHAVEQNTIGNAAYQKSIELAEQIVENGPIALRMAKKAINQGLDVGLPSGLAIEEECYLQLIPTADRTEGLEAFAQKRKPRYVGK